HGWRCRVPTGKLQKTRWKRFCLKGLIVPRKPTTAINCRIRTGLHYKSLTPPPARRKAANPILVGSDTSGPQPNRNALFGDNLMPERPIDFPSLTPHRQPRRSLLSARKLALMASVVAGLGIVSYGFGPSMGPNFFAGPAHAQVANEVRKVQQPVGFADIVE